LRCVHPVCTRASGSSAQHRAGGRNILAPAVTQLLMLRCFWQAIFQSVIGKSQNYFRMAKLGEIINQVFYQQFKTRFSLSQKLGNLCDISRLEKINQLI
jgi:hypothetical protein